jgi:hypothetical protein
MSIASPPIAGCAGFILLFLAVVSYRQARYNEFLEECTQYRPRYECILLWQASDRKESGGDPLIMQVLVGRWMACLLCRCCKA